MRTTVLLALLSVALATTPAAQDWNQWRGPFRSGVASTFPDPPRWPDKPVRAWQVKVGTGHASPVVAGDRAFQFARTADQEVVTAVELVTGRVIWQQRYDAPYQVNPAATSHGKGPKSTPAIAGARLFTFGISGMLSAFDTATGKPLWRKQYAREFDAASPDFGVAASPLVDGELLIVHVGGKESGALAAFDIATGAERWSWKGDGPAYASPAVGTLAGRRQVITLTRSHVVGVDASTGGLLWRTPFSTAFDQNIVTPVIAGDLVLYSGIDRPLTAIRPAPVAGKWRVHPVWQNAELPMYMSSPVLSEGFLFGLTHRNKGQFFCVNARTGETSWRSRGREGENAAMAIAGGAILAATTEGELVVMRRDTSAFDLIRRYTVSESAIWAHPVPTDRGVLIKDEETLAHWTF